MQDGDFLEAVAGSSDSSDDLPGDAAASTAAAALKMISNLALFSLPVLVCLPALELHSQQEGNDAGFRTSLFLWRARDSCRVCIHVHGTDNLHQACASATSLCICNIHWERWLLAVFVNMQLSVERPGS